MPEVSDGGGGPWGGTALAVTLHTRCMTPVARSLASRSLARSARMRRQCQNSYEPFVFYFGFLFLALCPGRLPCVARVTSFLPPPPAESNPPVNNPAQPPRKVPRLIHTPRWACLDEDETRSQTGPRCVERKGKEGLRRRRHV